VFSEGLIDDSDEWVVDSVLVAQRAARHDRHLQNAEVVRRDGGVLHAVGVVRQRSLITEDGYVARAVIASEFRIVRRSHGLYPGDSGQGGENALMQGRHRRKGIASQCGVEIEGDKVSGVEANVDGAKLLHGAQKKPGADQQDHT
jgi:hypothetical protein